MAVIKKNGGYNALPIGYKRGNPIPLDTTTIWYSLDELKEYAASGATAYVGQIVSCVDETENLVSAYIILNKSGDLLKLASTSATGDIVEDLAKLTTRVSTLETLVGKPAEGDTAATGIFATLAEKANKGTTLAEYGIEDAYTKEETDARIAGVFSFKGDAKLSYEYAEAGSTFDPDTTYYIKNGDTYEKVEISSFQKGVQYYTATWDGDLLDSSGNVIAGTAGDVYQVDGAVYAYRDDNGTKDDVDHWVKLGTSTNMSAYATKSYVVTKLAPTIETVGDNTKGLVKDVAGLKTAVGTAKTDTAAATGLYAADDALDARITALEEEDKAPADAEKNVINTVNGDEFTIKNGTIAGDGTYDRQLTIKLIDSSKISGLGTLASKDEVTETDLAETLKTKLNNKADSATTLAGYGIADAKIDDNGTITLGQKTITPIANVDDKLDIGAATDTTGTKSYYGIEADINSAKAEVIGTDKDTKTADTIYGAKAYADAAVEDANSNITGTATDAWDANKTLYGVKNYTDSKASELIGTAADTSTVNTIYGAKKAAQEALEAAEGKVASVTAGDNSISIAGTATAPTVSVKLSSKTGNLLSLDTASGEEGLFVTAPEAVEYSIVKAESTTAGYLATYYLSKDGEQSGETINIPKDYLVKSAEIKVYNLADVEAGKATAITGMSDGDKYIDFVINSSDTSGNESHVYLRVQDLVDTYTGGTGIDISNKNVVSVKVSAGNGLSLGDDGIAMGVVSTTENGVMLATDKVKLDAIEEGAQENVIEAISTPDGDLTITNKKVAIPGATAQLLGLVKGSADENKIAVADDGTMEINSLNVNKLVQTAGDYLVVDGGSAT